MNATLHMKVAKVAQGLIGPMGGERGSEKTAISHICIKSALLLCKVV